VQVFQEAMSHYIGLKAFNVCLATTGEPAVQLAAHGSHYLHWVYTYQQFQRDVKNKGLVIAHPVPKGHHACVADI
jgi:hypothetical protein